MFSDDQIKCPSCAEGHLRLDLVEGWLECGDCDEHFGAEELRTEASRMEMLADWLEQSTELAQKLQAAPD